MPLAPLQRLNDRLARLTTTLPTDPRQAFVATVATLQRVVELGYQRGERTPWAKTVRTCQQILQVADALWTFLETRGIEPTNNAAERALSQSELMRRALKAYLQSTDGMAAQPAPSAFDRVADLVGCCDGGPPDLSTNAAHLAGEEVVIARAGSRWCG